MPISNVHDHSIQTFYETEQERAKRRAEVFEAFIKIGRPATDREICYSLGYSDLNSTRPRVSEMIDSGELIEVGKVIDHVTGRKVRISKIRVKEAQLVFA